MVGLLCAGAYELQRSILGCYDLGSSLQKLGGTCLGGHPVGLYGIAGLDPGRYNMRGYRLRGEKRGRPNLGEHELGGCILVGNAIGGFSLEARIWETRQLRGATIWEANNWETASWEDNLQGGYSRGGSSLRGYNLRCYRTRQKVISQQRQTQLHHRCMPCTFTCIALYRTCVRTLG